MKIVFIGTVNFSEKMLKKLVDIGANVVGVCTKKQSSFNTDFADLTPLCEANLIPYQYIDNINSVESIKWIKRLRPDIIFCFGWSSLIKSELLQLAPMGVVGYHPAKLPENRGRHPIIWALALGLKQSASTFFFMDEGADSGDLLSQINFDISDEDDAKTVYEKITDIAQKQLTDFVPQLENNNFKKIKQQHNLANLWRKRSKQDGKIDFRMTSVAIFNLIRSLTRPYVGAHIEYQGNDVVVWKAEVVPVNKNNIEPGTVLSLDGNAVLVKTYDGAIRLLNHEFDSLPTVGEYL